MNNGLSKAERLTGKTKIDLLFAKGKGFIVFPFRVVYMTAEKDEQPAHLLVNVAKKRFKRANKRNQVKRYMKETYRLNKGILYKALAEKDYSLQIAILYLENDIRNFAELEEPMKKLLKTVSMRLP